VSRVRVAGHMMLCRAPALEVAAEHRQTDRQTDRHHLYTYYLSHTILLLVSCVGFVGEVQRLTFKERLNWKLSVLFRGGDLVMGNTVVSSTATEHCHWSKSKRYLT